MQDTPGLDQGYVHHTLDEVVGHPEPALLETLALLFRCERRQFIPGEILRCELEFLLMQLAFQQPRYRRCYTS
jgi:hypothetical protein